MLAKMRYAMKVFEESMADTFAVCLTETLVIAADSVLLTVVMVSSKFL